MAVKSSIQKLRRSVLQSVKSRGRSSYGVNAADQFFSALSACGIDGNCLSKNFGDLTDMEIEELQKRMSQRLTWTDLSQGGIVKKDQSTTITKGAVMDFECIMTSSKKDRDGDVMDPLGCKLDPRCKLLYMHIPEEPLGIMVNEIERDEKSLSVRCSIADTAFGRDIATLVEFDALDISHGFDIHKADKLKKGRLHIKEYETYEISLVTVPANSDAIITAYDKKKLKTDLVNTMAKSLYDGRKKHGLGMPDGVECSCKKNQKMDGGDSDPEIDEDTKSVVDAIIAAAGDIVFSDYGNVFFNPSSSSVWIVVGDSQGSSGDDTDTDTIMETIGSIDGVESAETYAEEFPPKGEGWIQLLPELMEWEDESEEEEDSEDDPEDEESTEETKEEGDDVDEPTVDPDAEASNSTLGGTVSSDNGRLTMLPGTLEHRMQLVSQAINAELENIVPDFNPDNQWGYVFGCYDTVAIVEVYGNDGSTSYYEVPYTIDGNDVTVDTAASKEVVIQLTADVVSKAKSYRLDRVLAFDEFEKCVSAKQIGNKAGASLSSKNKDILKGVSEDIGAVIDEDDTMKKTSKMALKRCSEKLSKMLGDTDSSDSDGSDSSKGKKLSEWADIDRYILESGLDVNAADIQNTIELLAKTHNAVVSVDAMITT